MLNGRSFGDKEVNFTYIGASGYSVIDLAAISFSCLRCVNDFRVIDFPGSDHLPIECSFKVGTTVAEAGEGGQVLPLLPKLRWTESDNVHYRQIVARAIDNLELADDNQQNVNNIIRCIVDSASVKPAIVNSDGSTKINNKQPWFDYECLTSRKRLFRVLNLFRTTSSKEIKNRYL